MRVAVAWSFLLDARLRHGLRWWIPLALFAAAIGLNLNLATLFYRANGVWFALRAIVFHQFHYVHVGRVHRAGSAGRRTNACAQGNGRDLGNHRDRTVLSFDAGR